MRGRLGEGLRRFWAWWTVGKMGLVLAVVGLVVTVAGHLEQYGALNFDALVQDFYANLGTELLSIALTVLIIDALAERRADELRAAREREKAEAQVQRERERLIRQLGSTMNTHAKRAAEEMRGLGLLEDGTLVNAPLAGANLEGAHLRHANLAAARLFRTNLKGAGLYRANLERAQLRAANLQGARLGNANLRWANLTGADLQGAYLSGAKLEGAVLTKANLKDARGISDLRLAECNALRGALMPDGSLYDGRFNLPGDRAQAQKDGVDLNDARALKKWYAEEPRKLTKARKSAAPET